MAISWSDVGWGVFYFLVLGLVIAAIVVAATYRPTPPAFSEQYFKFTLQVPNQAFTSMDMLVKMAYDKVSESNLPTYDTIVSTCKAVAEDVAKFPTGTNPAVYVQAMGQTLACQQKCVQAVSVGGQASVNGQVVESVFTKGYIAPIIMTA